MSRDFEYPVEVHEPMEFDMVSNTTESNGPTWDLPKPNGTHAVSIEIITNVEVLRSIFFRPRMFCDDIESLKDLLIFVQGVCKGHGRPSGMEIGDLGEYMHERIQGHGFPWNWTKTLLKHFSDRPLFEACSEIVRLLDEWLAFKRESRTSKDSA